MKTQQIEKASQLKDKYEAIKKMEKEELFTIDVRENAHEWLAKNVEISHKWSGWRNSVMHYLKNVTGHSIEWLRMTHRKDTNIDLYFDYFYNTKFEWNIERKF